MLKRNLTSELMSKFNEALNKIMEYKMSGKNEEALIVIDNTLKEIFRLGMKFFNSLSDDNLLDMIKTDGTINTDKCIMMAKLLEEEASILELQGNLDDAFYIELKSLNLFLHAYEGDNENCDLQHHFEDIEIMIEELSEYRLPSSVQNRIIDYYVKTNKYDKAEDTLYEILQENDFSNETIEKGISLYELLLNKDDNTLEEGNLSREEVEESLSILKKRL
ncbi:DUF6483 family protein [Clostridium sp. A1-XYC3]|uniref:DUF6483 family protein n=1 Tax=Clostridium tanneri TaxID=3037988 RepID=A0ABU4JP34_9CLOT|nr:DUF6483 family protein [Clostridium sp. A1-XYC3]MDW8799906.1 DUF6483 family protein [Clostridium sp. A1-XYC3]